MAIRSRILIQNPLARIPKQFDFISLKGQLQPMQQAVEEITRPGVDGVAFRNMGLRPSPVELTSIEDLLDGIDVENQIGNYRALVGRMATIWDDFGTMWADHRIMSADRKDTRPLAAASGGRYGNAAGAILMVRWVVIATDTEF